MNYSETVTGDLTSAEVEVVHALSAAHLNGDGEVSVQDLAGLLGLAAEEVGAVVAALIERGLCDRGESPHYAALSAAGLKAARELDLRVEAAGSPAFQDILRVDSLIEMIRLASTRWRSVVADSSLTAPEKESLLALGEQFFSHPATLELLRRALERA